MEIVIHGTKGGRKIFTPNKLAGFLDVTSDSPKVNAIGQNAYAIRFISGNTIFSKYKIIRDVRGDKRTGFVGFSIFLPNNKKLSGTDIIALLDKVSEEYSLKYIVENNLNEVKEDWEFIKSLTNEYNSKLLNVSLSDIENMQSGDKSDAFIYYRDSKELESYYNTPNQDEYIPYRQILFISNELKDKPENPLNALRNSGKDLTGEIDLENPFYKLRDFYGTGKNEISISIKNSKDRQLHNKDKVYRKEELTIVYSKKYYIEKRIIGSLLNNEEIRKCLIVSENDNKIDVVKDIELDPEVKTITFDVIKNKDKTRVYGAEITCKNNFQPEKSVINNQITFRGEELKEKWTVSAKTGYNLFSNINTIDFNNHSGDNIIIELYEKRVVKIFANEEEAPQNAIYNFKVWVQGKVNTERVNEVVFTGDEIDKTWNISVEYEGYQRSETLAYCPATDKNPVYFSLKKTQSIIEIGKGIKDKDLDSDFVGNKENSKWYQKSKNIIGSLTSVLVICIGIWFFGSDKEPENMLSSYEIKTYLEADALILDTIKDYKANWEKQNPQKKEEDGILDLLWPYNKEIATNDDIKRWNDTKKNLEDAIKKRTLIDKKSFWKLKEEEFSVQQDSFINTVKKIDKEKIKSVTDKLDEISDLTLTQIATKIDSILKLEVNTGSNRNSGSDLNTGTNTNAGSAVNVENKGSLGKTSSIGKEGSAVNTGSNKNSDSTMNTSLTVNTSTADREIINYLKSDKIKYQELENYKNKTRNPELKKSIDIALQLWELDGYQSKMKKDYLKKIENNNYLEGSKLNQFVKEIVNKDKTIKKTKLQDLKEIRDENN